MERGAAVGGDSASDSSVVDDTERSAAAVAGDSEGSGISSFNQPLNDWNVSNVHDMFVEATSFNHALHAPWYVVEQSESE